MWMMRMLPRMVSCPLSLENALASPVLLLYLGLPRMLSKALEQLFPTKSGYDISVAKLHAVARELDEWLQNLPAHLRLEFT